MSGKKSGQFTKEGIEDLAKDKPVVYKILSGNGNNIYTGSAKKGRVEERLKDHLPGGKNSIPGGKRIVIEQKSSITKAQESEERIIRRAQPKHNKRGK